MNLNLEKLAASMSLIAFTAESRPEASSVLLNTQRYGAGLPA